MSKLNLSQEELAFENIEKAFDNGLVDSELYIKALNKIKDFRNEIEKASKQEYSDFVVLNERGDKILLLLRGNMNKKEPNKFCLPGGHVDEGENVEVAAYRELKEETGIEATPMNSHYMTSFKNADGSTSHYFCTYCSEDKMLMLENSEHFNYEWVSLDKIVNFDLMFDLGERISNMVLPKPEIKKSNPFMQFVNKISDNVTKVFSKPEKEDEQFEEVLENQSEKFDEGELTTQEYFEWLGKETGIDKSEEIEYFDFEDLEKADKSNLVKKKIWVTRGGKTFQQNVWVNPKDEEVDAPVGSEIAPEIKGMNIQKYSDKSILITGDTYVNIDALRDVKKEIGVGTFNKKLNGWIFPIKFQDSVLGILWSKLMDSGNEEKASAIQHQKNAAFEVGDVVSFKEMKGSILENVSNNEGIKYDIKLEDGSTLYNVDEKVLEKQPLQNDKEIADKINNASPENRAKTEKQIFGFKETENAHTYTLEQYASLHGITQEDINNYLSNKQNRESNSIKPKKVYTSRDKNKPSTGLTKNQIIARLISKHKESVRKQIEAGNIVSDDVVEPYVDLKELNDNKKKELSEEHKRKIAEALRKNKFEEKVEEEVKDQETKESETDLKTDMANYSPKETEVTIDIMLGGRSDAKTFKAFDYTDVPAIELKIPKEKDILNSPKPNWIPDIEEKELQRIGYQLIAQKVGDDKYLLVNGRYNRKAEDMQFSNVTLDVLTASQQYYRLRAKAELKEENKKYYEKTVQAYKDRGLDTSHLKVRNTRIKTLSTNKATYGEIAFVEDMKGTNDRKVIWNSIIKVRDDMGQKIIDMALHQEYVDNAYSKGAETSYGDINTKDDLFNEYGIKVKRQNGDEINKSEIEQIKNGMDSVSSAFGKNIQMNKEFGLKISHSGDVLMHARKAVGLFHPAFNAIGVSSKRGDFGFQMTLGHEYAHFMDYWVGKKNGHNYASDKQDSTANQIAKTLRENMNKKQKSNYYNRTCECFARSLEQYHAVESMKDETIFDDPTQVNKAVYENQLKPLIQKFLQENKEFLKSLYNNELESSFEIIQKAFDNDLINSSDYFKYKSLFEKARGGIYTNTPENRKLGRVGQKYGGSKEKELSKEEKIKNFKEWFGDSKVVDEDGKPLVVYHGTSGDFDEFDPTKSAYYFSKNPKYAEKFANAKKRNGNSNILPVYLKAEKIKEADFEINHENIDRYLNSFKYLNESPDAIVGFDSKTKEEVIVVFNQNQIKSAIGNKGTFDPNSNNINKSNEDFEKAVYKDNAKNRKLKRVGQEYGSNKKEDSKEQPKGEKEEVVGKYSPEQLQQKAKETPDYYLEQAAKNAKDPLMQEAAKKELEKRNGGSESKDQKSNSKEKPTSSEKEDKKVKKSELITIIGGEQVSKEYIESLYNDHVKNK
jgi:ADP-ribose pyrophosphatase YjhB (NUDIX family)